MPKGRVAILGSFDTWSYMDFISRIVAKDNWLAYTSKYNYFLDPSTGDISRTVYGAQPGQLMIDFLRDDLIKKSDKAIVIYSVSAGHYNEVHWCADQNKKTLGIAFVRDIREGDPPGGKNPHCDCLRVDPSSGDFSACRGGDLVTPWTAWDCINAKACPFKKQGISLNQVEYFQINKSC